MDVIDYYTGTANVMAYNLSSCPQIVDSGRGSYDTTGVKKPDAPSLPPWKWSIHSYLLFLCRNLFVIFVYKHSLGNYEGTQDLRRTGYEDLLYGFGIPWWSILASISRIDRPFAIWVFGLTTVRVRVPECYPVGDRRVGQLHMHNRPHLVSLLADQWIVMMWRRAGITSLCFSCQAGRMSHSLAS